MPKVEIKTDLIFPCEKGSHIHTATDSRLRLLESGMTQILKFVQRQPEVEQPPQEIDQETSTPVDAEKYPLVSSLEETGEHNYFTSHCIN